jgi:hypothetical protein
VTVGTALMAAYVEAPAKSEQQRPAVRLTGGRYHVQ